MVSEEVKCGTGNILNVFPLAHIWLCWITLCNVVQAILITLQPLHSQFGASGDHLPHANY